MGEEEDKRAAQTQFKKDAEKMGLCPAFKVFSLGTYGTALVSCGLPPSHNIELEGEVGVTYPDHITVQRNDDGSTVTFRWPV